MGYIIFLLMCIIFGWAIGTALRQSGERVKREGLGATIARRNRKVLKWYGIGR